MKNLEIGYNLTRLSMGEEEGDVVKKALPIGIDDFLKVRVNEYYYIDKTLMIKEFIEMKDEVALIARPRRFGKTLNMTMIREFFDITKDSRSIFKGLAVMDTAYAGQINSRPVLYFTFKDCKGDNAEDLAYQIKYVLVREYDRYRDMLDGTLDKNKSCVKRFYQMSEKLDKEDVPYRYMTTAIRDLTEIVYDYYGIAPILLIDEYDQPIMSSYEFEYHNEVGTFFSNFYGQALKGNPYLWQALLTGIQRVAKESIFSQLNNPKVYTVLHKQYASFFGLTILETKKLLNDYDLELNDDVSRKYDGYRIYDTEIYNPWSILNYADSAFLDNYWTNTSSNYLVKQALTKADKRFWESFDVLAAGEETMVWLTLETSYVERDSNYSLWGLLVNAGYLTVTKRIDATTAIVKIPNEEVMTEFQTLITEIAGIDGLDLQQMFSCLMNKNMKLFFELYQNIVIACTSFMDAKENAYHMLFLGMCITLRGAYKVTSNIEAGFGRSDITLESLSPLNPSVIVEFKQGEDIDKLKEEALKQILYNKYYTRITGEIICVGLAHDKKRCSMAYRTLKVDRA